MEISGPLLDHLPRDAVAIQFSLDALLHGHGKNQSSAIENSSAPSAPLHAHRAQRYRRSVMRGRPLPAIAT
jgi:hypothetical protein